MKAVVTSQIILLVLGTIVLAVIGYLVHAQYVAGNSQFGQSDCERVGQMFQFLQTNGRE